MQSMATSHIVSVNLWLDSSHDFKFHKSNDRKWEKNDRRDERKLKTIKMRNIFPSRMGTQTQFTMFWWCAHTDWLTLVSVESCTLPTTDPHQQLQLHSHIHGVSRRRRIFLHVFSRTHRCPMPNIFWESHESLSLTHSHFTVHTAVITYRILNKFIFRFFSSERLHVCVCVWIMNRDSVWLMFLIWYKIYFQIFKWIHGSTAVRYVVSKLCPSHGNACGAVNEKLKFHSIWPAYARAYREYFEWNGHSGIVPTLFLQILPIE